MDGAAAGVAGAASATGVVGLAGQPAAEWPGLKRPQHLVVDQLMDALSVSPLAAPAVLEVARRAHAMPYPPHWSEEIDVASGAIYFYHELRDEASWQHPLADTLRAVLDLVADLVAQGTTLGNLAVRIEEALEEARRLAAEELARWVGPLPGGGGEGAEECYFYNRHTEQSEWEDPRERWRYDLQVRYELLVGFLVSEERSVAARFGRGGPGPRQPSDLTPTLTSLASSMSSVASLLTSSLTAPGDATGAKDELANATSADTHWARPRPARRGALPLPPRAATGGPGSRAVYSPAPHQQRYAGDVLQHDGSSPDASPNRLIPGVMSKTHPDPPPPPPPPGAPPRGRP